MYGIAVSVYRNEMIIKWIHVKARQRIFLNANDVREGRTTE